MITGSHYANSPVVITEQVRDVTERKFALGIFTSGSSAESYAAGLLGLFFSEKMREVWVGELKNEGDLCQVFLRFLFGAMRYTLTTIYLILEGAQCLMG